MNECSKQTSTQSRFQEHKTCVRIKGSLQIHRGFYGKKQWLNATMFTWQCNQWKISPWNKKNSHQNPFCLIGNLRSVSRGLDFGTWSRFGRNCSRCYFFNKTQSWYIEYFANIQSANTRCVKSVLDGLLFFIMILYLYVSLLFAVGVQSFVCCKVPFE